MKILEKINLRTSLSLSIIGVLILLFLSNTLQPKLIEIKDINSKLLEKQVKVSGQINSIRSFEDSDFQIISLKDETGKIDITTNKILNLTTNQSVSVIGKITEYEKDLQIQAEKIVLIE